MTATTLTSPQQIREFLEERLLAKLATRKRSAVATSFLLFIDKLLLIVPFPVKKKIAWHFGVSDRSVGGVFRSSYFWFLSSILSVSIWVIAFMLFLLLTGQKSIPWIYACTYLPVWFAMMGVILWSSALRPIGPGQASAVQMFCSTPERAEIVAGWISKWGGLRSMDAHFIECATEDYNRQSNEFHEELEETGQVVLTPVETAKRSLIARISSGIKDGFASMYAGNVKTHAAVNKFLHQGELGKHLEHANLEQDTPKAASESTRPRL